MPIKDEISHTTEKSEFLKAEEIEGLKEKVTNSTKNFEDDVLVSLSNNMESSGLSVTAFNIDGRAPLNELGMEVHNDASKTIMDVEELKSVIEAGGNIHRKDEATTWWEKVEEHYKKLFKNLNDNVLAYNEEAEEENKTRLAAYMEATAAWGKGDPNTRGNAPSLPGLLEKILIVPGDYDCDSTYKVLGTISNEISVASEVTKAETEITKFQPKVPEAKAYNEECSGLQTNAATLAMQTDRSQKGEGRVTGGSYDTLDEGNTERHSGYRLYKHKDGSSTKLIYDKDGEVCKEIHMDKDGNIVSEEDYTKGTRTDYSITKNANGIYTEETTEYKKNDKTNEYEMVKDGSSVEHYENKDGKKVEVSNDDPRIEVSTETTQSFDLKNHTGENTEYAHPHNFQEMNEAMKNHQPIILDRGYNVQYDLPGPGASAPLKNLETSDGAKFLVYSESRGKYYEVDVNGELTNKFYLDPKEYEKGINRHDNSIFTNKGAFYSVDDNGEWTYLNSTDSTSKAPSSGTSPRDQMLGNNGIDESQLP